MKFMTNLQSDLINFVADVNANFPKLIGAGFSEDTELFQLMREYALINSNAGNFSIEIISNDIPNKIQKLYENNDDVRTFLDSISTKN